MSCMSKTSYKECKYYLLYTCSKKLKFKKKEINYVCTEKLQIFSLIFSKQYCVTITICTPVDMINYSEKI